MAKTPIEPPTGEFHFRPGVPPFEDIGWGGVNTEDDPISLRINELQRGQNIRRVGRGLRSRPGLVPKIDLTTAVPFSPVGAVMWLKEAPVVCSPLNLWASCRGIYGSSPAIGASLLQLESTASPMSRRYASIVAAADRYVPVGEYGGKIYLGDGPTLRELVRVSVFPDTDTANRIPTIPNTALITIAGYVVRCFLEFDGKLFVGLENVATPASSKIMVWDGLELKDDLTAIRPPLAFGIWRDKLVAGFDATAGNIRYRSSGAAPGSWTTVALAGFQCATQGNAMQEVRQYLYIASGVDKIFRFDGAALTLVRTIAGCAVDGNGATSLTLHNGLLYYGWNAPSTAYTASLGRHDPDSTIANEWVDSYKALTVDTANFVLISSLASYRGQIFCGGRQQWIVATAPNDVKGALESVSDTGAPLAGYDVLQLLRF
jgi:hypothetical protein